MKEIKAIIESFKRTDFSLRKAVLATVVKVTGSSYRSPGARMLITDDGKWTGSISGGCLEGDALRKARTVMQTNTAATFTYDTREESHQSLGIALGCNGVIDVLFEPLSPQDDGHSLHILEKLSGTTVPVGVATIYRGPAEVGKKMIMHETEITTSFEDPRLTAFAEKELWRVFTEGKSSSGSYETEHGVFDVFTEVITPQISLVIFGGGFDARPVSIAAKMLGWNVTVTDECISHIAPVFFPNADTLSLCSRERAYTEIEVTAYTACVLMSHNYEYDRDILKSLLLKEPSYIGILGPRKRFEKMLAEFRKQGVMPAPEKIDRIHSPIGLDIGAETPEEIAISIVGEIQAVFADRTGGFLKSRSGPIHSRMSEEQVVKHFHLKSSVSNL